MSKFIQTHFFIPSTFLLSTKQKENKIKSFHPLTFPSSYHFLSPHFSTSPTKRTLKFVAARLVGFQTCVWPAMWHFGGGGLCKGKSFAPNMFGTNLLYDNWIDYLFWNPNHSKNLKIEKFKVFEVGPKFNQIQTVMI